MSLNESESTPLQVLVNGKNQALPMGTTVAQLLNQLGIPSQGTAVELKGNILAANRYAGTELADGDQLEIVRLVGGG